MGRNAFGTALADMHAERSHAMHTALFDSGAITAERRNTPRPRALKHAHIRFNRGFSAYEATVRDLTSNGARLRFGDIVDVPGAFDVRIGPDDRFRKATIRWRSGLEIGIAFSD
jgi:hypothetical protein